jgi:hypothetical protein
MTYSDYDKKKKRKSYRMKNKDGMEKMMLEEGGFVLASYGDEKTVVGQVVHVMTAGSVGQPGDEMTVQASEENPALFIRVFEQDEDGEWYGCDEYILCSSDKATPIEFMEEKEDDAMTMGSEPARSAEMFYGFGTDHTKAQRLTEVFRSE